MCCSGWISCRGEYIVRSLGAQLAATCDHPLTSPQSPYHERSRPSVSKWTSLVLWVNEVCVPWGLFLWGSEFSATKSQFIRGKAFKYLSTICCEWGAVNQIGDSSPRPPGSHIAAVLRQGGAKPSQLPDFGKPWAPKAPALMERLICMWLWLLNPQEFWGSPSSASGCWVSALISH